MSNNAWNPAEHVLDMRIDAGAVRGEQGEHTSMEKGSVGRAHDAGRWRRGVWDAIEGGRGQRGQLWVVRVRVRVRGEGERLTVCRQGWQRLGLHSQVQLHVG